jgi:hypothetical protein
MRGLLLGRASRLNETLATSIGLKPAVFPSFEEAPNSDDRISSSPVRRYSNTRASAIKACNTAAGHNSSPFHCPAAPVAR